MLNCPMKDKNYLGNCEYCSERTDCMIREMMERLATLEAAVATKK